MPAPDFFRQLGLFVLPDFLAPQYISNLCTEIAAAPAEQGTVSQPGGNLRVDLAARKVACGLLPKESRAPVKQKLLEIQPALEKHFGVHLTGCEQPQYLVYRPGDFFKAHRDNVRYAEQEYIGRRRISVVIFLNRQSQQPAGNAYGEGDLVFYGLLEGPQWEQCAFPLKAGPGLLIAFPSDKLHEVMPISHGQRFTIVTWFYGPEPDPAPPTVSPQ